MHKKNLNVCHLNVVFLQLHGEVKKSHKEVTPETESISCIDAGYWQNKNPWVQKTRWANKL